jgi:signal transduction histidine kinase
MWMISHLGSSDRSILPGIIAACDHLADGMVIIDHDRTVTYINTAALQLVGRRTIQGQSLTCCKLLHCAQEEGASQLCGGCAVSRALREGQPTPRFEVTVSTMEGPARVEGSCSPVPGPRAGAVMMLRRRSSDRDQVLAGADVPGATMEVLRSLVRSARDLLLVDYAALGRVDVNALEVVWLVQEGARSVETTRTRVPVGRGIRGRVISTGQTVLIRSFPDEAPGLPEEHPTMRSEGLHTALAVPIYIQGERTGVLMVATRSPREYRVEQEQLLRTLAGLAGEVLSHAHWAETAQAASIRAEREWLAAELHDGLAQLLAALSQKLKLTRWVLGRSTDPAALAADMQEVLELSEQAHSELRMALGELRAPAVENDFLMGLRACLANVKQRTAMTIELEEWPERPPQIQASMALQVLRVIQEALTNARKHSGGTRVAVRWTVTEEGHVFAVSDDGSGISAGQVGRGYGLAIMADRAKRIGGTISVTSGPDTGCTVILTVPHQGRGGQADEASPGVAG